MTPTAPDRRTRLALAVAAVACMVLFFGWRLFWFNTDDAFIAFRYVSNNHLGHGYTWNPPPFRPVEGYTSFLWVVLLDFAWRVTGVEPPRTANLLSLLFSWGSVVITALAASRMELIGSLRRLRSLALILILAGVVTHRTFITWTSSGLETALFNFLMLAWVFVLLFTKAGQPIWVLAVSLLGSLTALARPEGAVVAAATVVCVAGALRRREIAPGALFLALPLLAVPAHLLWRRATYGFWLPNTYHAKAGGFWPESGARYLLSFVIEYSLWIFLALAALWIWRATQGRVARRLPAERERLACAVAAFAVPFAYYTFVIGGDHFEYRIYSGLVPPVALMTLFFVDRLLRRERAALALLLLCTVAGLPIPWTHYFATRQLTTRETTHNLAQPIAPRFPWPLRPYVGLFDELQAWLVEHLVCTRHQEHKVFAQHLLAALPPREQGEKISWDGRPVIAANSVGVLGWSFPHVGIIDTWGLNDHVIARSPSVERTRRKMAHDKQAPEGYLACFKPNFDIRQRRIVPRSLTDAEIRACEAAWWDRPREASVPRPRESSGQQTRSRRRLMTLDAASQR